MEQKHTPGPWRFEPETEDCCGEIVASNGHTVTVFLVDPSPEDARLIAAAPDLLEALTKVVNDAEQAAFEDWLACTYAPGDVHAVQSQWEHSSTFSDFCEDWKEARAAIAKATGNT